MWKIAAALVAAAGCATQAQAQDQQIRQGPPAAWIQPAAAIKVDSPDDGAAVRFLLMDSQLHFGAEGVTQYAETAVRVQNPQGLQAMSTVTLPWDPALGTLTLHKLHILRGGEVIDVLAKQQFTVLRRERNLEAQQLDGWLTAVIQPEDLRVGDVIDMAYSLASKDPALAGHVQAIRSIPNVMVDDLRLRASGDQTIFWRASDGLDGLKPGVTSQGRSLSLSMTDVQPVMVPTGAPLRFRTGRSVQFSDFKSWAEVSSVMAPLFAKASTLPPDSPLQAEIARIKAASSDPKARAQAALALVQDQVRYVNLAMNDGGYVPAEADTTWKRRFGDCKGKTVLLLSLLHGLGIEAQPTLASISNGDGLDERLPTLAAFDHVLVRATIGGRVYWLDGTRLGDKRLDDIDTPNFSWTLPVQASGATLVRLTPPPLTSPTTVVTLSLDASKGLEVPATAHAEAVFRGDAGWALNARLNDMAPAQRQAALRDFWTKTYGVLSPVTVTTSFDPLKREERVIMDGTANLTWDPGNNNTRVYYVAASALGGKPDFTRQPGPRADAPFAVPYPAFAETHQTVILPNKGQGFRLQGGDVDQRVAGRWFSRKARIEKGVFKLDVATQSLAPEFPASEAPAAEQALKDLAKASVYIGAPANYRMTAEDVGAYQKKILTTPRDLLRRGDAMRQRGLLAQARTDLEKAISLDPKAPAPLADIAQVYALQGDFPAAHDAVKKSLALKPDDVGPYRAEGFVDMVEARYTAAVEAFGKVLAKDPADRYALRQRAIAFQNLNDTDKALADADALLKANARDADARQLKVNILLQAGKTDLALAEADAGLALAPKTAPAHVFKGDVLRLLRRDPEAQAEYDAALDLDRSAGGYVGRAARRLVSDHAARLKDAEEALKLDPDNELAQADRASEEALTGQVDKAIAHINDVVAKNPDDLAPRRARALIYARAGKPDLAAVDVDWMRAHAENTAADWNETCYGQATADLSLDKALADCDKGVSLAPRNAGLLDSRALVLLRLGRTDDAIAAYDLALTLAPRQADSLYGRGLAKIRKGQTREGQADLTAALAIRPHIDDVFAEWGLKPPEAYASSNSATK